MTWEVIYGDCIKGMVIDADIEPHSIDMVFADPPFGIDFDRRSDDTYGRSKERRLNGYKEIRKGNYYEFTKAWLGAIKSVIKPSATIYIVSGWTNTHIIEWIAVEDLGWFKMNKIIWHYSNPLPTQKKYRSAHYEISVFVPTKWCFKQTHHTFNLPRGKTQPYEDVWYIKRDMTVKKHYLPNATKLPNQLVERCILTSTNEEDLVLDPFVGNGTTPAMCVKHGRHFIGYEVNENAKETIDYMVDKAKMIYKGKRSLVGFLNE